MNNHTPINERTFEFAVRITKLCSYLDKQPGTPRLLAAQLFRSGTSIGANIEESRSAESDRDFVSKQSIALKEARETKYWLKLLVKSEIVPDEKVAGLVDECEQLMRIIAKSIVTTKGKMKNN
ncbi:four helix bundle protein [Aphanizomenon flos-aquae]|jgi:four helix bundle protein|uniref:Four helix bundle protein n=1 Tax=Aphanizomenon flos-aquae FACHB-1040 TaxID=2692887 RepID=A0ABR8BUC4_APHFL|nr:four helix bundle protein [Aphanizomenon flos-aquae]MBD2278055.1 four helix bundle protein [Aphanizomenon flos-aquae FACHB-1040]